MNPTPERLDAPVVYVVKRFPRLSETFILHEMLHLEAQGVRIVVQALLPPEPGHHHPELTQLRATVEYIPTSPRLRHPGVAVAHLSILRHRPRQWWREASEARRNRTWRRFLQAGVIAQRAQRLGARHLHAHFATAASEVARSASALTGTPFTVTAHAKDIFSADNQPLLRRRVAGASTVVTVSRYNERHLQTVLPGTQVQYIPNGVACRGWQPRPPDGPVLCVARLVPKKGIDTLIRAIGLLGRSGEVSAPRLEVVGGGPLLDELRALVAELGLGDRVRLLGPLPSPSVHDAFQRCSMAALACRVAEDGDRDGMPTVLLEAMARGLPVISTDVAGIPELVQHDRTGLLVAPDDPKALAEAIDRMWRSPELADRLGREARRLVAEEFDPDRSARHLAALFCTPSPPRLPEMADR